VSPHFWRATAAAFWRRHLNPLRVLLLIICHEGPIRRTLPSPCLTPPVFLRSLLPSCEVVLGSTAVVGTARFPDELPGRIVDRIESVRVM
jgi:hypothetical protein